MKLTRFGRDPFSVLREEIDRLFDRNAGASAPQGGFPAMNLWEDKERLYVEVEVPGIDMEHLDLTVQGDALQLSGRRAEPALENGQYHRRERGTGVFRRTITLPVAVVVEDVEATLTDGVLSIALPKAPSALPRRIEIR